MPTPGRTIVITIPLVTVSCIDGDYLMVLRDMEDRCQEDSESGDRS